MREWFEEVLMVLSYSWRTQLFIVLGPIIAALLVLFSEPTISDLQSSGFRVSRLVFRIEYAVIVLVFSSWVEAWRSYRKDRKRLFSL